LIAGAISTTIVTTSMLNAKSKDYNKLTKEAAKGASSFAFYNYARPRNEISKGKSLLIVGEENASFTYRIRSAYLVIVVYIALAVVWIVGRSPWDF
jgi:hypothetical protein